MTDDRAPRSDEPTREERGTLDLFARLPVGSQPVETSENAADHLERSRTLAARRWNVLLFIASCGELGATADEVEQAFGLGHNATSPRVTELLSMGYLERSTVRRKTRHGSSAFVHVVSEMGRQALATKRAA